MDLTATEDTSGVRRSPGPAAPPGSQTPDGSGAGHDSPAGPELGDVGWVRLYFADERWEWSPQVARMHGYEPGSISPTTAIVLSHKHPDDRPAVQALLDEVLRTGRAFSSRHRIIDTRDDVHEVIVVGTQLRDDHGEVIGTQGFYIDLRPARSPTDDRVAAAIADIVEHREVIEQAKGMLMLIYHIDGDRAFEVLRWRSQQCNVKLRLLAEQITADFRALDYDGRLPDRDVFDHLLLTAHERVERRSGGVRERPVGR
ncbi:PAS and ANTAR domain-containing protein [Mycobacterium sp.]|uniref:PAS and ANTAR domain-containing protein n=1 Tax=Mycobacterium sp. TaxID=1785 RepID=UPI002C0C0887|nr:PAS and ANTAR domain-containing protein [Mycobacterium sp.]HME47097.1 PAS and ANTAR domain-containing protein [Mycobacterium sp.]